MIELKENELHFQFPEVHEDAHCAIEFQRTLRIPDDERTWFLPPGLGGFPLRHLDDYAARLPEAWRRRGGVIMPMHQAEALWINFNARYPFAVKVATGKICAVTGEAWVNRLNRDPQDYVVVPEQPWLDGYCIEKGVIRQFVAMPLGRGLLGGGAAHRGGPAWRVADRGLSHETGTLRGAVRTSCRTSFEYRLEDVAGDGGRIRRR